MMLKNKKYIWSVIFMIMILSVSLTNIVGAAGDSPLPNAQVVVEQGSSDWWGTARSFFSGTTKKANLGSLNSIKGIIQTVGNMIFVAVTVILGIKYIWGGVDSKASVKDSLITLVVAAIAFYSWTTIEQIFVGSGKLTFIGDTAEKTASNIYSTIIYICNFAAIGGIVYIGVRYLMAGAEGKATLKAQGVPIILGIIMVYATIEFLTLATSVI